MARKGKQTKQLEAKVFTHENKKRKDKPEAGFMDYAPKVNDKKGKTEYCWDPRTSPQRVRAGNVAASQRGHEEGPMPRASAVQEQSRIERDPRVAYETTRGVMYVGKAEEVLKSKKLRRQRGKVQLVFTSPPFPLNRKKRYGNLVGEQYLEWLATFAPLLSEMITDDGSIVLEMGNAWEPGNPVMSTLALRSLLRFQEAADLKLCQQFVAFNPARLPSPAQWVSIERVRVKDSYTHVWWFSKTAKPKADNRRVLVEYSQAMKDLLETGKYNAGTRPSEFKINETSFLVNNGGAIPSNVLTVANTRATDPYLRYCKKVDLRPHPARMSPELPEFFVNFLTDKGDLVLDPFGGSNTTGAVAETHERKWISIEPNEEYALASEARFRDLEGCDDKR